MSSSITVKQNNKIINVTQNSQIIEVKQNQLVINVYSQDSLMTKFTPFGFTATDGQTAFTVDSNIIKVIGLYINGTSQSEVAGDFSVSEKIITLDEGVDAGDYVFGIYQELGE